MKGTGVMDEVFRLERKLSKYAIPNLMKCGIFICVGAIYTFSFAYMYLGLKLTGSKRTSMVSYF